ncbi:MAG: 8-amino-7-oxononanoate synthase [Chthoniobacteraceae bacterium]
MATSIEDELAELRSRSLLRRLRTFDSPQQPEISEDGRLLASFASNDYLGLANEPLLREAAKAAIDRYGVGSGASRLTSGTLAPHTRLEESIARFKGTEAALSFSSGYATALGALGALCGEDDVIVLDKLCHASLIDGARLSRATIRVFPHNHLGKIESHLEWAASHCPGGRVLIVTEAIFSMDGDRAPLAEIVALKNRFGAMLLVDEAHAVGVLGRNGRGLADALRLEGEVDIQMGTLSKALGVAGGYVAGSRRLVELLINRARSFIYSTAPPPAIAAAATAAIDFMMSDEGEKRREQLWRNLAAFGAEMPHLFSEGRKIQSAIVPVILGDAGRALEAADRLLERGFYVPAIRYPTVPRDAARLRVSLSARHTTEQITALCSALRSL